LPQGCSEKETSGKMNMVVGGKKITCQAQQDSFGASVIFLRLVIVQLFLFLGIKIF
jgi:hypothetical protein